jgi:hypothetical protein
MIWGIYIQKGYFIYNVRVCRGTQMTKLDAIEYESFETIKKTTARGIEFWYARDLQNVFAVYTMAQLSQSH